MNLSGEPPLTSNEPVQNAWRIAMATGWLAAKKNRVPGLVMWLFGVAIIGGYFFVPPVHTLFESIGRIKSVYGFKFSMVSTGIFGGMIPVSIAILLNRDGMKRSWEPLVALSLFWAYKGLEIDLFYHFQAWLFGSDLNLQTIATKTLCDQLIMVPVIGMPNVILFYLWRDCGYSFKKFWAVLGKSWYRRRVLPVLIANWTIWIPAVVMIYCLPLALQLPVQNLILCFWVLILMFFTNRK